MHSENLKLIKFNVFPVNIMKVVRGCRGKAPLFLNVGAMWELVVSFMPCHYAPLQKGTLMSIEWEAGWAPELLWTFWRREKSLVPVGIQALDRPAHTLLLSILTMLSQLHINNNKIQNIDKYLQINLLFHYNPFSFILPGILYFLIH
jgi:hypothetical protein